MSEAPAPVAYTREHFAAIAAACADAGQPEMAARLIAEGVSLPEARTRLDVVPQIQAVLALGRTCPKMTAEFRDKALSGRMTVLQVRTAVLDAMAETDAETVIDNKRLTGTGAPDGPALMKRNMVELIEKKHGPEAGAKARAKLNERKPA